MRTDEMLAVEDLHAELIRKLADEEGWKLLVRYMAIRDRDREAELARLRSALEAANAVNAGLVEALKLFTQPLGPINSLALAKAWIADARHEARAAIASATEQKEGEK